MEHRSIIETQHSGAITDVAVDNLGRRLASGGDDKMIHVWAVRESGSLEPIAALSGHDGSIVQLAWAPYRFGSLIASCSTDKQIMIWSELADGQWVKAYSKCMNSIPTSIAWAPHEYGPQFACSTSNGKIHVFHSSQKQNEHQWDISDFDAHANVCTSISWAPFLPPGSLCTMPLSQQPQQSTNLSLPPIRLVSAGNERSIKVWRYAAQDRHWVREELVKDDLTTSWVEVAWAPNIGLPFTYIAAGSTEGFVVIWSQDGLDGKWKSAVLPQFSDQITRLSWSHIGTFLLVSCSDQTATMWRELPSGEWELQSTLSAK